MTRARQRRRRSVRRVVLGLWWTFSLVGLAALERAVTPAGPGGDLMAESSSSSNLYGDATDDPLKRALMAQAGGGAPSSAPSDDKLQELIRGTSYLGKPGTVDLPGTVSTPSPGGP